MSENKNHLLEILKQLSDTVSLYALIINIDQSTVRLCERTILQMKACQNNDTIETLKTFIVCEKNHIRKIYEQHIHDNADVRIQINNLWLEQQFINGPVVEILANPYLLTPRRAFDLAIHYKRKAFDFFTVLAANLNDPDMRKQIEDVALRQLKEIPELRLYRFRESKKETKTALQRLNINTTFSGSPRMDHLNIIVARIENLITNETQIIQKWYTVTMPDHTAHALENLIATLPDPHVDNNDYCVAKKYISSHDASLFSALKALLGELDMVVNLFLTVAGTSRFENIVQSAQNQAKQYVKRITPIRHQLDIMSGM